MSNDCFIKVREKFSLEQISDEELRSLIDDFAEIKNKGATDSFMEEVAKKRKELEVQTKAQKAIIENTRKKTKENTEWVLNTFKDDPKKGIRTLFTGTTQIKERTGINVENMRGTYLNRFHSMIMGALKKFDISPELMASVDFVKAVRMEMYELGLKGGKIGISGDARAQAFAKDMHNLFVYANARFNKLGVPLQKIQNYMGWQAYDREKLLAMGPDKFKQLMLDNLDHEKSFTVKERISEKAMDERLAEAYKDITEGTDVDFTKGRSLHYKSGEATHNVLSAIGKYPNLLESMVEQTKHMSRTLALTEIFGPDVKRGVEAMKRLESKFTLKKEPRVKISIYNEDGKTKSGWQYFKENMSALKTDIDNFYETVGQQVFSVDNMYRDAIGITSIAKGGAGSRVVQAIRALQNLVKLGGAVISSIGPDIANSALLIHSGTGKNFLSSVGRNMNAYFSTLTSVAERQNVAYKMHVGASEYLARFAGDVALLDDNYVPGLVSKATMNFFRITGLTGHTEAMKAMTAKVLGTTFAEQSHLKFGELSERMRYQLKVYGIADNEWEALRKAVSAEPTGAMWINSENILGLKYGDLKGVDKERLYLNFNAMMTDYTRLATVEGDAFTRTALNFGTRDDEALGMLIRLMSQFKTAPIQGGRLLNRVAMSKPGTRATGIMDAFTGKGDTKALVTGIVALTTAGYVTHNMKEILKGQTPPDPTKSTTWIESMKRSGAFGLYTDYIFSEYDKSYRNLIVDLAGPTASDVWRVSKLASSLMRETFDAKPGIAPGTKRDILKFGASMVPGNNIWYTKAALDHLVLDYLQESLTPGYMIQSDRTLRNRGQRRWLPSTGDL